MTKDLFGQALLDYHTGNFTENLITWTNISEEDELPSSYLFRSFSQMPILEQKALKLAKGRVLDVGCGAGNHSLWLQKKNVNVKAIDISKGASQVCKQRGIANFELKSLIQETERFDTILLLMNGTGIFQELNQVSKYLNHLKTLLNPHGQILIDSSDISYMFEEEDGGRWVNLNQQYYGELDYFLSYKNEVEEPMKWLYLDFTTLQTACAASGLNCEKVINGEHFDYLARISIRS